jgi:hypothetical protein
VAGDRLAVGQRRPPRTSAQSGDEGKDKKVEMKKVKKIVENKLNTRTGIKALGGSATNNSCTGVP